MKKILILLVVLAAAYGGYYMWSHKSNGAAPAEGAGAPGGEMGQGQMVQEVGIVTIAPQSVNFTKDLPGRTTPYRISEIRPQASGIITKRLFEEGSNVTEGQQLYQIDPASYEAAYNSSKADVMKAEANLKVAQASFQRSVELVKVGALSKQVYDDRQATLGTAKADVAIAKAALATAKINLDYTKVYSPINGRIGKSMVTEGALVTANQATALATVQQLDPIYVDVTQSSSELMDLRKQLGNGDTTDKTPVTLLLDGTTNEYDQKGELQFSDVTVDQTTGAVQLRILFPNTNHDLLPGMFVRARVAQNHANDAILVPQQAVNRQPDGSVTVWVVGAGDKVAARPIKVSQVVNDQWLVTDGLTAGDRVVVEGVQKVAQDAVVKPVDIAAAQKPAGDATTPAGDAAPATNLTDAVPSDAPPSTDGAVAPTVVTPDIAAPEPSPASDASPQSSATGVAPEDDMVVPDVAPVANPTSTPEAPKQ